MCIICTEIQKGLIKPKDVTRHMLEFIEGNEEHASIIVHELEKANMLDEVADELLKILTSDIDGKV